MCLYRRRRSRRETCYHLPVISCRMTCRESELACIIVTYHTRGVPACTRKARQRTHPYRLNEVFKSVDETHRGALDYKRRGDSQSIKYSLVPQFSKVLHRPLGRAVRSIPSSLSTGHPGLKQAHRGDILPSLKTPFRVLPFAPFCARSLLDCFPLPVVLIKG